ncbi:unnamed protein product [Paramecium octaurelia]|uniref:Uncharacterized protein n=1 Tax=Paramecium octaurelia TaxID=43137 RepID=A0A8S1VW90_PAROT|nr:unnamed protein product [Paramecium octaurelia]
MIKYCSRLMRVCYRIPVYRFCKDKFEISEEDIEKLKQLYQQKENYQEFLQQKEQILENVFKEREQLISFKLMQMSDIDEVFDFYSKEVAKQLDEKNPQPPFNCNELSLFLYFTSCLRNEDYAEQMKSHSERFQQIASKILLEINKLDPEQFCAFVWALSTYQIEMGDLNLNDSKQFIIKQQAEIILEKIPPETLPSLAFSLNHILKEKNELILKISKLTQLNITIQTPSNLITLIKSLPAGSFTNSKLIFEQLTDQFQQDLLTQDQFVNVLVELLRITNHENTEYVKEMVDLLTKKIESTLKHNLNISMQKVIDLILSCLQLEQEEGEQLVKQMLRICHAKSEKLNISEYISLFLAVAKVKNKNYQSINLEKTIKILIELSNRSQVFTLNDFEQKELVQVIVASAALRIDNKDFIRNVITRIDPLLLHKQDLLLLAKSFVIYVRLFEVELLKIHSICAKKKYEFSVLEQAQLTQTFNRIKVLIPDSPFLQ